MRTNWKGPTIICQGDETCCSVVGLASARNDWRDFYLTKGLLDAERRNEVSAQLWYVSVNVSGLAVETVESGWESLPAEFLPVKAFTAACEESCALKGLNGMLYELLVEVEDAELYLDTVSYAALEEVNEPPVAEVIGDREIEKNGVLLLNLSRYFSDETPLAYEAESNTSQVVASVEKEMLVLEPRRGFTGEAMITVKGSDGELAAESSFRVIVGMQNKNTAPKLVQDIPNITLAGNESAEVDLGGYFEDSEDELAYSYSGFYGVSVLIVGEKGTLAAEKGFSDNTTGRFIASDGKEDTTSNEVNIIIKKGREMENVTLLKEIPSMRAVQGRKVSLPIAEYFSNAEQFSGNFKNVSLTENRTHITLTPDNTFRGAQRGSITAAN
jgi:hypothetical protein